MALKIPVVLYDGTLKQLQSVDTIGNSEIFEWDTTALVNDHTGQGQIIYATAAQTIAFGSVCHFRHNKKFWKTNASLPHRVSGTLAINLSNLLINETGPFLLKGLVRDDTWNFGPGSQLYLSTSLGMITQNRPDRPKDSIRIVGQARDRKYVFFNPDNTYIELADPYGDT